jgi:hypothetical protein
MPIAPERENPSAESTTETAVSTHSSSPDRTVFTENGNSDAWIATDLTVDLQR